MQAHRPSLRRPSLSSATAISLLPLACSDVSEDTQRHVSNSDTTETTASPNTSAAAARPHILLITLDTMRVDFLSPYGAPEGSILKIAALADRGVVFKRMLAASSRTAPAHASLSLFLAGFGISRLATAIDPPAFGIPRRDSAGAGRRRPNAARKEQPLYVEFGEEVSV